MHAHTHTHGASKKPITKFISKEYNITYICITRVTKCKGKTVSVRRQSENNNKQRDTQTGREILDVLHRVNCECRIIRVKRERYVKQTAKDEINVPVALGAFRDNQNEAWSASVDHRINKQREVIAVEHGTLNHTGFPVSNISSTIL